MARLFPELSQGSSGDPENVGRLFEAVARCLAVIAAKQPLVLVLEDLHWADEMSLRLLSFVGRRVPGAFLVLGSAREEDLSVNGGLRAVLDEIEGEGRLRRVALAPLAKADTLELVGALMSSPRAAAALPAVAERVWTLSEGNPFVVFEAVRSLESGGADVAAAELALPDKVRAVIEARLQRLGASSRELLALAALVGRDFDFALLSRASGLEELQAAACIEEMVRHRVVKGVGERFLFVHDRVREVADRAVASVRRPGIHRAVAQALEELHAARRHEVYDRLARHWALARDAAKAIAYLRLAAEQNAKRYALPEAFASLEEAERLVEQLPEAARPRALVEIAVQQAAVIMYSGRVPEIPGRLLPWRDSLEALNDPGLAARFHFSLGFADVILGDRDGASAHLHRAIAESERARDLATAGGARAVLSFEYVWASRFREGAEMARASVRALEATGERHWLGKAWFYGSVHYAVLGDFARALEAQERAEAIARETDDQRLLAFAAWALGFIHALRRKPRAALAACRRAVALAPDACGAANAHGFLGYAHLVAGQAEQAIAALEQGARESAHFGFKAQQGWFLAWAGEAHLLRGDAVRAAECAEEGLALTRQTRFPLGMGCAQRALGRVALARGAVSEARSHLEPAVQTFAEVGAAVDLATTRRQLAALAE
jgi:tetratricopeptide (TPR) repeat protein